MTIPPVVFAVPPETLATISFSTGTGSPVDGTTGALPRAEFEHLAEERQHGDDGGCLEIQGGFAAMPRFMLENLREQQRHNAERISGSQKSQQLWE
jgi:hypothetical protein